MRGQSIFDYLAAYGWALFVVVLMAVALWKLGAVSPVTKEEVLSEFQSFEIKNFTWKSSGFFYIEIVGRDGGEYNITELYLGTPKFGGKIKVGKVLKGGESLEISGPLGYCEAGRYYVLNLEIRYAEREDGNWSAQKRDTAKISVLCEKS